MQFRNPFLSNYKSCILEVSNEIYIIFGRWQKHFGCVPKENPDANLDNGTCEYNSCADDCGVPFGDNSTCNPIGCGDPQADNYDPNAAIVVIDPEYCEYVGCTDQNSFNYNPTVSNL